MRSAVSQVPLQHRLSDHEYKNKREWRLLDIFAVFFSCVSQIHVHTCHAWSWIIDWLLIYQLRPSSLFVFIHPCVFVDEEYHEKNIELLSEKRGGKSGVLILKTLYSTLLFIDNKFQLNSMQRCIDEGMKCKQCWVWNRIKWIFSCQVRSKFCFISKHTNMIIISIVVIIIIRLLNYENTGTT